MKISLVNMLTGMGLMLALAAGVYYWYAGVQEAAEHEYAAALEQGIELFDQQNFTGALQELQKIPADQAEDWRVHYYIGSSHMMLKDYAAAAESLERALELEPNEVGTLYALGVAYYKLGNLKLSKAYFAAVLEINPNDQHAKGLMDVMTKLEQQPATEAPEPTGSEPDDQ